MNCKTPILDEPFGQPSLLATVPPQIAQHLQALVTEAVAPLLERIADLEATIAALEARLAALEGLSAPPVGLVPGEVQSPQQVPPTPESVLLEEIFQLRADVEMHNEARALEIAQDRRRIAALEVPEVPPPTAKTLGHLDRLDREMRGSRIKQLSFTNAARLLGLSSSRIRQLKPLILEDRRFAIVKDPHHRQRLLIRTNFRM